MLSIYVHVKKMDFVIKDGKHLVQILIELKQKFLLIS